MKELTDLFKGNVKLSCTEICIQLRMSPRVVIDILIDLQDKGEMMQLNGYWFLPSYCANKKSVMRNTLEVLNVCGPKSIMELSYIVNTDAKTLTEYLSEYLKLGHLVKYRRNGKNVYSVKNIWQGLAR